MKVLMLCSAILFAQSLTAVAATKSKESVSFTFRMISWGAEPLSGVALPISGELENLYAPIDQRSEERHYQGPEELVFYNSSPNEKHNKVIAKLTASQEWREVLFLAQYNRASDKLNILTLDDSDAVHPQNSIRLINLSGRPIGGLVGREKVMLEKDGDQIVDLKAGGGFLPLQFARKSDDEADWRPFVSTAIETMQGGRLLIVFYPSFQDDPSGERDVSFKLYYDAPIQEKFSRLD